MKVLIAEDDLNIRRGLADVLTNEGYVVVEAADGTQAVASFEIESPEIVCLDIMMPGVNGYDVCRKIRAKNEIVPILFISAKSEEVDRVLGLELGADDFIVKPFGVREVVARIRAITRRLHIQTSGARNDDHFQMLDLTIHPKELRARRGDEVIELSLRDIKILQTLHTHAGQAVSRDELFNRCWGLDHMPNSRTLDQHISQLRTRVETDPKSPRIIRTVQGIGYRFEA